MLLKVHPPERLTRTFNVPPSKPETQRAILTSALAEGVSHVFNDLRCGETETMKAACRALGVRIVEHPDHLEIEGVGGSPRYENRVINAAGSGLVFRTLTALCSVHPSPVIITGDKILCGRVMAPLLDALRELGANIQSVCTEGRAPVVNWGGLRGGLCHLPGDVSSQFITAILFAGPFAENPVEIEVSGEVYSKSYIQQTITSLRQSGIDIVVSDDFRYFRVNPGRYLAHDTIVKEDYTSASYLLAAAALCQGSTVLNGVQGESEQGEEALLRMLVSLGLSVEIDRDRRTLTVENASGVMRGDLTVDVRDCPNIVPTLAAMGAYVDGTLRLVGGKLTRFHKASRIEAMVTELRRAGVDISVLADADGVCDGFQVRGAPSYPGGCVFSSWGDHRIFMALFVASLRMATPCLFSGFEDVALSFPEFLPEFARAGVQTSLVEEAPEAESSHVPTVTATSAALRVS